MSLRTRTKALVAAVVACLLLACAITWTQVLECDPAPTLELRTIAAHAVMGSAAAHRITGSNHLTAVGAAHSTNVDLFEDGGVGTNYSVNFDTFEVVDASNIPTPLQGGISDLCPHEAFWAPELSSALKFWPDNFIDQASVDYTYAHAPGVSVDMRLQILDGNMYFRTHPRGAHLDTLNADVLTLARNALEMVKGVPGAIIPNVDYMWQVADVCLPMRCGTEHEHTPQYWSAPVFSMCDSPHAQTLPIPNFGFAHWNGAGDVSEQNMQWSALLPILLNASRALPYSQRISKAMFRGDLTAADRSAALPFMQGHSSIDISVDEPRTPIRDYAKWKVQIYLAGHGYSSQLRYLLASGSPVVYHTGTERGLMHEFFFPKLRPWVHFVPVWHPAQLVEVVEFLLANPFIAQQIGRNGQLFVEEHLSPTAASCYLYYTWRAYERKLTGPLARVAGSFQLRHTAEDIADQYERHRRIGKLEAAKDPWQGADVHESDNFLPFATRN